MVSVKHTGGIARLHLANYFDDRVNQKGSKYKEQPHSYSPQHTWNVIIKYGINEEMVDGDRKCGQKADYERRIMKELRMKMCVDDINVAGIVASAMNFEHIKEFTFPHSHSKCHCTNGNWY